MITKLDLMKMSALICSTIYLSQDKTFVGVLWGAFFGYMVFFAKEN